MKPQLLGELQRGDDVRGWLAFEKLDGFRAMLREGRLWSREGHDFQAPAWWLATLPQDVTLDGELYHSRSGGLSAVKRAFMLGDWQQLSFRVFDAPEHGGKFTDRLAFAETACRGTSALIVPHTVVSGKSDAWELCSQFVSLGGEGVVLRAPGARYEAGKRVRHSLKVKP